jgi:hypothetical protein
MNPKLRFLAAILFLGLLTIANLASRTPAPAFQTLTPTPTGEHILVTGASQAGTTNGIALLGILIFAVIILSIAFHLRDLRATRR